MRSPNLNSLRAFDAAARRLNFRIAAEELNVTQGAVAQQVRRLETDLARRLFERKARGLALTAAGRTYHAAVARALAIIDEATNALRPESSRITISVPPSFASKWLVPRLGVFAAAHPEIELRTIASERVSDFRADGVDLAVRQGGIHSDPALRAELLAPLELCAVAGAAYAATLPSVERLADLAVLPLIQDDHGHWDALLGEAGLKPQGRVMRFNQTALAMDAAANGQGVALAPRLLIEAEAARGALSVLWRDERADRPGFHLVWPRAGREPPALRTVLDWIVAEAEPAS